MTFAVLRYNSACAFTAESNAAIAEGDLIALNATGQAVLADATSAAPYLQAVGVAAHAASSGQRVLVLPECTIYTDDAPAPAAGVTQFLSDGAGGRLDALPTNPNDLCQPIGVGRATNVLDINITMPLLKLQAAGNSTVAYSA